MPTRLTVPFVDGRPADRLVVVWGHDPHDGRPWQLAKEFDREAVYTPVPVPISMAGGPLGRAPSRLIDAGRKFREGHVERRGFQG